jgi:hypothetical protein
MTRLAGRSYRLLIRAASSLQSPFLLAVPLYWGWQFMQTGCEAERQPNLVASLIVLIFGPGKASVDACKVKPRRRGESDRPWIMPSRRIKRTDVAAWF